MVPYRLKCADHREVEADRSLAIIFPFPGIPCPTVSAKALDLQDGHHQVGVVYLKRHDNREVGLLRVRSLSALPDGADVRRRHKATSPY